MPPISLKKVFFVILVVILLARLPDIRQWVVVSRIGELMADLGNSIWEAPIVMRRIITIEIMALLFVIYIKFFRYK
jgi:hypothetical protein